MFSSLVDVFRDLSLEPTVYNLDVECYIPDATKSVGDSRVSTQVVIAVCDDSACGVTSQPTGEVNLTDPETAEILCFGDRDRDEISFEVYENSGPSVLGSVNAMPGVVGNETGGYWREYAVRQSGERPAFETTLCLE